MKLKFWKNSHDDTLHVDGEAECGRVFSDCALVIESESSNPILKIDKPLGFSAVKDIIAHVEALGKAN